ncbi:Clavaminate synthase-like protein [Hyaloscypha bicolor E]|uniref:Clavaminate synthase-like protein n=1 Tax=Hyaloscypha bicolor E TaxID=1095630 RepID=A0A2J6T4R5_9HELO|nr:Clavaminate synthase-like protein [Hyaloscypha bicolor E]PMD58017.1 Clavaminate synthase-like protein [Hyaloscypha bicolor E]
MATEHHSIIQEWPTTLNSTLVWDRKQFTNEDTYIHNLSNNEKAEINAALNHFKGLGLDGQEVNRQNFPLPTVQERLRAYTQELYRGKGFFSIRGLDPNEYSPEDNVLLFLGISSYVAERRGKQDSRGNIFAHIRNATIMKAPQEDRPFKDSTGFHNDMFCDILAMQSRARAAEGGRHFLSPALTVYNELAVERPDLLEVLATPNWTFDNRGRDSQPKKRALLFYHGGHVILNFVPQSLVGLPNMARDADLPPLSRLQHEALEAVQRIAVKHQLALSFQPGDLTFVNNFAILHAREAFTDDEVNQRYLVRMWLKNDLLAWKLPHPLQEGSKKIFHDKSLQEVWNIAYTPRLTFEIRECFSP